MAGQFGKTVKRTLFPIMQGESANDPANSFSKRQKE